MIPLLRQNGIPVGPVNTVSEALSAEHTLARNMVVDNQHASIENLRGLGTPLKMHDTPTSVRFPPPRLGEHTRDVLSQYLDQNSIDELLNKKVIS